MKRIKRLTDADIIGAGGMSGAKPRRTARAILKNNSGRYALVYSAGFNMYCFPGGGIEDNEDILTALKRELMEETGCSCDAVEELGIIEENRANCDYMQISYYYVVSTHSVLLAPSFTNLERKNGAAVGWHTLEETVKLITRPQFDTPQKKFLQVRDIAALNVYLARINASCDLLEKMF